MYNIDGYGKAVNLSNIVANNQRQEYLSNLAVNKLNKNLK